MPQFSRLVVYLALVVSGAAVSHGADWLTYRGPSQDGSTKEVAPGQGRPLRVRWTKDVGTGTASFTVQGDRLFTMGNTGGKESVYCLNTKDGSVLWQHTFPLELKAYLFEGGPRSTPTVHNGKVYTVSWAGDLFCLDAITGKQIWYKHLVNDFGGEAPDWGYSGSPFIDGNNVILDIGGKKESTVALNKETGALVWKNGRGAGGYATPVAVSVGAKRLLLVFKGKALVAHDPATGSVAWQQEWKTDYDVNAASPMVVKNKVLLSSGYNTGAGLFEFSAATIKQVWRNKDLAAHISTPVLHDGLLFGPHGECDKGPLRCVDWETGALKWEDRSIRGGALILAGNELIVVSSKGELHIGPAVAKGFVPRATLTLPKGRYWAQPTLANGAIFCRTNKGDVTCVE